MIGGSMRGDEGLICTKCNKRFHTPFATPDVLDAPEHFERKYPDQFICPDCQKEENIKMVVINKENPHCLNCGIPLEIIEPEPKNKKTKAAKGSLLGRGLPRLNYADTPPMPKVKKPREEVFRSDLNPDPELVKAIAEKIVAVVERDKKTDRVRLEIGTIGKPSPVPGIFNEPIGPVVIEGDVKSVTRLAMTLGFETELITKKAGE